MPKVSKNAEEIEHWLISYLSQALGIAEDRFELDASFNQFGLESSAAAAMTGDLADWLGVELDPVVVFEHPTIGRLSAHLAS